MDFYNFRPQWKQWSYPPCYKPTCGRCGKLHLDVPCFAIKRKCYNCGKFGHYSRMCKNYDENAPKARRKDKKSRSQRERDNKRISRYFESKNILRELPFSSLRSGQFADCVSDNSALKEELKRTKSKLKSSKQSDSNKKENTVHLLAKVSELENKNIDVCEKLKVTQKERENLKLYVKQCSEEMDILKGKLETADRQGKDLSRKLKDTLQSNADLQEKMQLAKSKEQELTLQLRHSEAECNSQQYIAKIQELNRQLQDKHTLVSINTQRYDEMQSDYCEKLETQTNYLEKEKQLRQAAEAQFAAHVQIQNTLCFASNSPGYTSGQPYPYPYNRGRGRFQ